MKERRIPIMLCIDVEPDSRKINRSRRDPWPGYDETFAYMKDLRSRLKEATRSPVHYNWFFRMDPQIADTYGCPEWIVREFPERIREMEECGDEIGLHPHAYRWVEKRGWLTDHGNPEWTDHCVRMAFEAYERVLGRPCRSFRFGDRWMSTRTARLLEELGCRYDLTLEPGYPAQRAMERDERNGTTGSLPDTRRVPSYPYRPSREDFRVPDNWRRDGLWMLPMTTGKLVKKLGRLERLWRSVLTPAQVRPQPLTLNFGFGVNNFSEVMERAIDADSLYLTFVVRSDVAARANGRQNMEGHIDRIVNHGLRERFLFATPEETLNLLGLESPAAGQRAS